MIARWNVLILIPGVAFADGRRDQIAGHAPAATLTKAQLHDPMHALVPQLAACQTDPPVSAVVNTRFLVESLPGEGTIFTVLDGGGDALRDCIQKTAATVVLPPIAGGGTADITYPITFAAAPPDNHDTSLIDAARAHAAAGRWSDALAAAEQGLQLTSLDGPFLGIAGVAACHVGDATRADHYTKLAAPEYEARIRAACAR